MAKKTLHVAYELSPPEHRFFQSNIYSEETWHGYSAMPRNWIERVIRRPKISRYRAAIEVVRSSREYSNPVIVSHMPVLSLAVEMMNGKAGKRAPHIAFAFNYTRLPDGVRKRLSKRIFPSIDLFVVFSSFEKELYQNYFSIPSEKILFTPWTQSRPPVAEMTDVPFGGNYFCAVGGEGRDYAALIEAAEIAKINLVIIARPYNLNGLRYGENVKIMSNLPLGVTWACASNSKGMILPLISDETCCGHITAVSAMMLGIPILMARSVGLSDYFHEDVNPLMYRPGVTEDLTARLMEFKDGSDHFNIVAKMNAQKFSEIYSRNSWTRLMDRCIDEI